MSEEVMPLVTDEQFLAWSKEHPTERNPYSRQRYAEAQREADLEVLEDYKAHLDIDYQQAVDTSVRKILEAKEKEWRENEADWLDEQIETCGDLSKVEAFINVKNYIAELEKQK